MKKFLTVTLFAATLATSALSVQALIVKPKTHATCGNACIAPKLSCPGGCFCDLSQGNGIDTGLCVSRH
ncbi:MAG TPA: hypothetical protein VHW72_07555 [Candidatus Angelobacter sp.]|nr:hypothetical protein [Candidatus Angelobacter sp.]